MLTYLHAEYIKEAINGILIQECNFPIELIIADDNSPDNTEEVVLGFLEDHPKKHLVYYTRHAENKGMHGNFQWMTDVARGTYIAQCEGDDYWTDPYKLQKQVDFLETNPEYGLVYTRASIYEDKTKIFRKKNLGSKISQNGILYTNPITSLTTLYRSTLNESYLNEEKEVRSNWMMGDYPKWIWFYYNSKIHFMNETTAVWRKLESSASNFTDTKKQMAFKNNVIKIQMYYGLKYLNDSQYSNLLNHILFNYYFLALIRDPAYSKDYYKEVIAIPGLTPITKIKLKLLEKWKFKHFYFIWFKIKHILKTYLLKQDKPRS